LVLDDSPSNSASNLASDRDHEQACEMLQIDNGAMDRYVTGTFGVSSTCFGVGPNCSNPLDWVFASGAKTTDPVNYYWLIAAGNALADRYFQPLVGGSASNDMYFAGAAFRFIDNAMMPRGRRHESRRRSLHGPPRLPRVQLHRPGRPAWGQRRVG
jgi:phospholipase C